MRSVLVPIASLLLSVTILLLGHGLQLTLLPLRADELGFTAADIGLTGSTYFLGFVVGCLTVPRIITRVGHIRSFGVLAATATSVLLVIEMTDGYAGWLALRFVTGWAMCGLYMVIESWLNEKAPSPMRGRVLAFYTMLTLLAMTGAQFVVPRAPIGEATLFMLGALFICASFIPVGLTRSIAPHPVHTVRFRPGKLFRTSQVAVVTTLLGGMITGTFWSLGPLYAGRIGLPIDAVSVFMSSVILGGAALQLPVGRLSDRIDRRKVILVLALAGATVSFATVMLGMVSAETLLLLGFLFGGTSMPLYALCVAHANDRITEQEFVEIASGILMVNSVGAVLGPAIASSLMTAFVPQALFAFTGVCFSVAAAWTAYRILVHAPDREHFQPFVPTRNTTQSAIDLDPRAEHPSDAPAVAELTNRRAADA